MTTAPAAGRGRLLTGAAVLVLVAQYAVAEVVAALAWTGGRYDWADDYVSDLGAVPCRPGGCSSLWWLFDASLVLHASLVLTAALLLSPLVGRGRRAVLALFVVTALGNALVGLFPLGADGGDTTHYVGAVLAIGGASLAVGLVGVLCVRRPGRRAYGWVTLACAATGLAGIVALGLDAPPGLGERVAIWPIVAWYVGTGVLLLRGRRVNA
ncbi:DUF998 domain-containing protein [Solicola sp. PLA-1-18]|uniref:DUF998 domain-containing protein n=1 Tax=Solicola sp. PLA-1-18 TaxID=3380532 RepID=UPI003B78156F